jgi:hypothetical protein
VGQRKRWLRSLALPGSWRWDSGDSVLSLSGELSSGSFLLREDGKQCSGRWRLLGHSRIYSRSNENVVPLRG